MRRARRAPFRPGVLASVWLMLATLTTTACSKDHSMDNASASAAPALFEDEAAAVPVKVNPQPRQAYTLTLQLDNAPGPFAVVEGTVQYDVENAAECGRKVPVAGAFPRITRSEPFVLKQVSGTTYAGTVHPDLLLDEDYYGRGVCRWTFVEARVRLRAHADERDTRFIAAITADAIADQQSRKTWFWKERYPRAASVDDYADIGSPTLDEVPESDRPAFFAATLSSQRVQP